MRGWKKVLIWVYIHKIAQTQVDCALWKFIRATFRHFEIYTECHSRSHRIPRPLDHDHVWSSDLFRVVLRLDCVSRPGYANSKTRYGIKSRRQNRVYSAWHTKHIYIHMYMQITFRTDGERERERAREPRTVLIVLLIFYSTPTRFRELDARGTIVPLRNQLRIAATCVLFPLQEKRCDY